MVNSEAGLTRELSPNLSIQCPKIIHTLLLLARRLSSLRSSVPPFIPATPGFINLRFLKGIMSMAGFFL